MQQSYFSRVSHIKEQLESIGDIIEEFEVVNTTLNGLPREWDSFIGRICSRINITKFNKLWEECVQEARRLENREEKLNEDKYQALVVHTKNGRNKRKDQGSPISRSQEFKRGKKFKKDYSYDECYTCHKLGHISRQSSTQQKQVQEE